MYKLKQKLGLDNQHPLALDNGAITIIDNITVDIPQLIKEYKVFVEKELESINNYIIVQKMHHLIKDNNASILLDKLNYTQEVVENVRKIFDFKDVTYRSLQPNTAYNWHKDKGKVCIHIPLITNVGCRFVFDTINYHMPANGNVYRVVNEDFHTFVNAGKYPRIHFMFENL